MQAGLQIGIRQNKKEQLLQPATPKRGDQLFIQNETAKGDPLQFR
jgi:hypothetical protein